MISDVYFPRVNGVSTSIQTFRQAFEARGHTVALIAPDYGQAADDGEDVLRIPSRQVLMDPEDFMMKRRSVGRLTDALRERDFDLLHIQTPFVAHYAGTALARRLGIPRVETYHTFFQEYLYHYVPFLPKSWMREAARKFSRWQCNAVDAVVVPSSAMLDVLREYGVRSPIEVIPTGLAAGRYEPGDGARFRTRYGIPSSRPTLVHVGRVAFEKNIGFLLQVLARVRATVPEVLLVIAGEGPALRQLQQQAADLGLQEHVLFVGYLSRDTSLSDCYCAADAFVFASNTETQGLVLIEAMAQGVPVVSTAVRGTKDILKPDCGALVAQEDVEDFAAKVTTVLGDDALRGELAAQARSYAREWSDDAFAERMLGFYRDVIHGAGACQESSA
jgi:1,2-diacylglycerol 3-alpha-glucosyltransferase